MHRTLHILVLFCAATVLQKYTVGLCESQSTRFPENLNKLNARHHCMHHLHKRALVRGAANAPQAVGFKCAHCSGEFVSRHAMDTPSHRRHPSNIGTPCADPISRKSLSFTSRADMSTGILRQHSAAAFGVSTRCVFIFCSYLHHFNNIMNIICIMDIIHQK
jgi:hypothetical protein